MQLKTKMISGVAAVGAAALAGGLFVVAPGVGAQFFDSAHADVNVDVGTFGCQFLDPDTDTGTVTVGSGGNATITLDTIQSSAPSHEKGRVKVENTGSMPLVASFSGHRTAGGTHFHPMSTPPVVVPASESRSVYLGIKWDELDNNDLGKTASVRYKMTCNETGMPAASFFSHDDGSGSWDPVSQEATLETTDTSGSTVGINLLNANSMPTSAPTMTATKSGTYDMRFVMYFNAEKAPYSGLDDPISITYDPSTGKWGTNYRYTTPDRTEYLSPTERLTGWSNLVNWVDYIGINKGAEPIVNPHVGGHYGLGELTFDYATVLQNGGDGTTTIQCLNFGNAGFGSGC